VVSAATQKERLSWVGNYGLGVDKFSGFGGFIGHNGAIPGYQSFMGYLPQKGATIVVLANSMVAPNIYLGDALPADALAKIIQQGLFA